VFAARLDGVPRPTENAAGNVVGTRERETRIEKTRKSLKQCSDWHGFGWVAALSRKKTALNAKVSGGAV